MDSFEKKQLIDRIASIVNNESGSATNNELIRQLQVLAAKADSSKPEQNNQLTHVENTKNKFYSLFHLNPALTAIIEISTNKIVDANHSFLKNLFYTEDEIIGKTTTELGFFINQNTLKNLLTRIERNKQVHFYQIPFHDKYRGEHIGLFSCEMIMFNQMECILMIIEDITQRRKTNAVVHSLARFPQENPDPVLRLNSDLRIIYSNKKSRLVDKYVNDNIHKHFENELKSLRDTSGIYEMEVKIEDRIFSIKVSSEQNRDYINLYCKDITERKNAETKIVEQFEQIQLQNEKLFQANEELQASNEELMTTTEELSNSYATLTETKRQLEESEKQLKLFFTYSVDGFFFMMLDKPVRWDDTVDKEKTLDYVFKHQRITRVNKAMLKQYGAKLEEFLGLTPADFFTENIEYGRKVWRDFFDKGMIEFITSEKRFDGTPIKIEGNYICFHDEQNRITGHFGVQRDVTKRMYNEELLKISEQRLSLALSNTGQGLWDWNIQNGDVYYDENWAKIMGYKPDEVVMNISMWENHLHPDDAQSVRRKLESVLTASENQFYETEYRALRKNNEYVWITAQGQIIERTSEGKPLRMIGIIQDITDKKQAEKEKKAFFEISLDLLCIANAEGYFKELSPTWKDTLGWELDELLTKPFIEFVHPDDKDNTLQAAENLFKGNDIANFDNRYLCKNGTYRWLSWKSTFLTDKKLIYAVARDIEIRKQMEENLRNSEEKNRAMLQSIPDMLFHFHRNGTLLNYKRNSANEAILPDGDFTNKHINRIFPADFVNDIRKAIIDCIKHKSISFEYQTKVNNENRYYEARFTKINDNEVIALIRDISDKTRYQNMLRKAKEEAENANRMKSLFLANMSHEIRTPMNAILGYTSLLKKMSVNEKFNEYLNIIHNSGRNLLALINDILDLSKIEAGKMKFEFKPINTKTIFNEIISIFKLKAEEKDLRLIAEVDQDIPETLLLDATRLRQVLFNVVGNALKFTEHGYIKISVNKVFTDNEKSKLNLIFRVEDTGIGIAESQLDEIFSSFQQQKDQGNKYGGTGLGLTITKNLVEMMHGEILVDSVLGKGSVFIIKLRDIEVSSFKEEKKYDITNIQDVEFENAIILLVEDNVNNANLVKAFLSQKRLQIIEARHGREAIDILKKEPVDLILMDMKMPVMDGYKATKLIKSNKYTAHIPLIALTAEVMTSEKEKIQAIGCDSFLSKPINENELVTELIKFLPYSSIYKEKENKAIEETSEADEKFLPDEIIEVVQERLNTDFIAEWNEINKSTIIYKWKQFGEKITQLGEEYHAKELIFYGKHIIRNIEDLNIVELKKIFLNFPNFVDSLQWHTIK